MKNALFCDGEQCSVKNTCLRYTQRHNVNNFVGGYSIIRKCTRQKKYLQDEDNVNVDSQKLDEM